MNQPRVVGYHMVSSPHVDSFNQMVDYYIDRGWQPYGPPMLRESRTTARFAQAFVQYEKAEENVNP